jgi:sulfur carrier protein
MKILVNNQEHTVSSTSLAEALTELGYDGAVIATALNGDFTPRASRAQTVLQDGDSLELLAPMRGG